MVVRVHNLIKTYQGRPAVDDVTFEIGEREVFGVLGPNGAGKTTTLQILTCYQPPTAGRVEVCGHDILSNPLAVRRAIGYQPENVPLYTDMRAQEYLRYRGRLKGLRGKRLMEREGVVLEMCGLRDVARQVIGRMSRGYRQRVGLADAMIADPPVLVLDEPTVGLDPNQIRQIRNLVRELAGRHTVLMASHILHEVEMVCDRVLIMNEGRVVALDSPDNLVGLLRGKRRLVAQVRGGTPEAVQSALERIPDMGRVTVRSEGEWLAVQCDCSRDTDRREQVFRTVAGQGWVLRELREEQANLEDVFAEVTRES